MCFLGGVISHGKYKIYSVCSVLSITIITPPLVLDLDFANVFLSDMNYSANLRPPPTPAYTLRGAGNPVTVLHFTESESDMLVSGCQNGRVHIWDLQSRRIKESFEAHSGRSVLFVKAENGAQKMLTQGRDGYLKIWKCSGPSYELEGTILTDGDGFCAASLLSQKETTSIALPGKDSAINVYDLRDQSLVQTLSVSDSGTKLGLCMCLCAIPNMSGPVTQLLAGYESGKLIHWDVRSGKSLCEITLHDDVVMCMAYSTSPGFNTGVSGSVDKTLVTWKFSDSGEIKIVGRVECTNAGFNSIRFRPDSKILVTAGWDNFLRIFSAKSLKPLCVLPYHKDRVLSVEFSENHYLAAGSKDHLISVWDVYRNK